MGMDFYVCGFCGEGYGSWGDSWDCDVCGTSSCPKCTDRPWFLLEDVEGESDRDAERRMDSVSRVCGFWHVCEECEKNRIDKDVYEVCDFFAGKLPSLEEKLESLSTKPDLTTEYLESKTRLDLNLECIKKHGFQVKSRDAIFYILETYGDKLKEKKTNVEWHLACEEHVHGKAKEERIKELEREHERRKASIALAEKKRLEQLEMDYKVAEEKKALLERLKDLTTDQKEAVNKLIDRPHRMQKF